MAWLSSGSSNEELINLMVFHGLLPEARILQAFRATDRGDFTDTRRHLAYVDRPFKSDLVHQSAPHMYAMVLDKLDLRPGHAFLNIGSGSGYLSCLASCLLGESGVSHGIEINETLCKFSKASCKKWFDGILKRRADGEENLPQVSKEGVSLMAGNCFDIDVPAATSSCKYDRIYIGAGCPEEHKDYFFSMLADDGIIVVPIDEAGKLLSIRRVCGAVYSITQLADVHFAPLQAIPPASALSTYDNSRMLVKLPPVLWAPSLTRHKQFPASFRDAARLLVLSHRFSPIRRAQDGKRCLCPLLPLDVWWYLLSFASRDWFVPVPSPQALLAAELRAERSMRLSAEAALNTAVSVRKSLERERDTLRAVIVQLRLQAAQHGFGVSAGLLQGFGGPASLLHGLLHGMAHNGDDEADDTDQDGEGEELEVDEEAEEDEEEEDALEDEEEELDVEEEEEEEDVDVEELDVEDIPDDGAVPMEEDHDDFRRELEEAIEATNASAAASDSSLLDMSAVSFRSRGDSFGGGQERDSFDTQNTERESFMSDCSQGRRDSMGDVDDMLDSIFETEGNDEDGDEDEGAKMNLSSAPVELQRVPSGVHPPKPPLLLIKF